MVEKIKTPKSIRVLINNKSPPIKIKRRLFFRLLFISLHPHNAKYKTNPIINQGIENYGQWTHSHALLQVNGHAKRQYH